jgi:hypothetical protein
MSIQDGFNKIKAKSRENGLDEQYRDIETVTFNDKGEIQTHNTVKRLFIPILIILISTLSFGIGRLSKEAKQLPIKIDLDDTYSTTTGAYNGAIKVEAKSSTSTTATPGESIVVGSAKSNKYHYTYCPGAKQISVANKITFKNAAAAEAAGYTLALNCKPR